MSYFLLNNRNKRKNEEDVPKAKEKLSEDDDLGNQGLPSAGGQGVNEIAAIMNTL